MSLLQNSTVVIVLLIASVIALLIQKYFELAERKKAKARIVELQKNILRLQQELNRERGIS